MKILHIIISLDVGGAELMLRRLVETHLDDSSFHHSVVSLRDVGLIGEQLSGKGVSVTALGLNSIFQLPSIFFRLFMLIRFQRPDIVHTWMYHADLIGGLAARLAGCRKVIWSIRNTDLFTNNGVSRSLGWIMKACAVLSSFVPHTIICVAHRAKMTHAAAGYSSEKLIVLSNGFDVDRYKPELTERTQIRKLLDLPLDALVVGSIGRFNEYKDHRSFILAAGQVASDNNRVYFLLIGRDIDSDNMVLMRWIGESGYAERFRLLGERADIPSTLAAMDMFCLHSKSEGFPNVLGEAMSAGLPSVVTDVGDAALMLGESGVVVPPQNIEALAHGIVTLARYSSAEREQLGSVARKRIIENYSIDAIKQQYENLYRKVMKYER